MSKAHDYTRKTTLTVFFHTIFPFEIFECKTNLHKPKFSYKTKKHRVRKHDALFGALTRFELVTITHASVPLPRGPKDYNGAAPQTPAAFAANGRGETVEKFFSSLTLLTFLNRKIKST